MSKLSEQLLFNKVVRGLAKQGWLRSMDPNSTTQCAYRGMQGRKCAAGHLLTDKEVEKLGNTALFTYHEAPKRLAEFSSFIQAMQSGHDNNRTACKMRAAFRNLARTNYLRWPKGVE